MIFRGKRGFGSKRLIVLSDLSSPFGDDQLETVVDVIHKFNVEINFMSVGFWVGGFLRSSTRRGSVYSDHF